jgi:signal peptidase I
MTALFQKRQREFSIVRDTIESVWVAIILAFVLRAFMIEAFVIPTGSMAPRLMGEHFDLVCPCGYEYSYGWHGDRGPVSRRDRTGTSGVPRCPSCTYQLKTSNNYVNGGDRVLVMKYLYRFSEPKPFDVVVFRNPQSNANNYIKRLIGLPGETIEIVHGDVFVTPYRQKIPEIRRKPDRAQEVMWQIVFDNDYQPDMVKLKEDMGIAASRRWEPLGDGGRTQSDLWNGLWTKSSNGRNFTFKGSDKFSYLEFRGVRYIVNDPDNAKLAEAEAYEMSMLEAFVPQYGYNDNPRRSNGWTNDLCSDLKLSVVIRPGNAKASAECRIDSLWFCFKTVFGTDGSIAVYRRPREDLDRGGRLKPRGDSAWGEPWIETKTSPMAPSAGCKVEVAHVDNGVKVWVDGEKVIDKSYSVPLSKLKERLALAQDATDLPRPGVLIGAAGGPLEFTHLKLMRDVYYTNSTLSRSSEANPEFLMDFANNLESSPTSRDPGWGVAGNPIELRKADQEKGEDRDLDQFFVLGDNSPQSLDSRGWIEAAPVLRLYDSDGKPQYKLGTVPRYNLIGKAIFVYWPSGYRLPLLPGLPIVPDVGRMRLIR